MALSQKAAPPYGEIVICTPVVCAGADAATKSPASTSGIRTFMPLPLLLELDAEPDSHRLLELAALGELLVEQILEVEVQSEPLDQLAGQLVLPAHVESLPAILTEASEFFFLGREDHRLEQRHLALEHRLVPLGREAPRGAPFDAAVVRGLLRRCDGVAVVALAQAEAEPGHEAAGRGVVERARDTDRLAHLERVQELVGTVDGVEKLAVERQREERIDPAAEGDAGDAIEVDLVGRFRGPQPFVARLVLLMGLSEGENERIRQSQPPVHLTLGEEIGIGEPAQGADLGARPVARERRLGQADSELRPAEPLADLERLVGGHRSGWSRDILGRGAGGEYEQAGEEEDG